MPCHIPSRTKHRDIDIRLGLNPSRPAVPATHVSAARWLDGLHPEHDLTSGRAASSRAVSSSGSQPGRNAPILRSPACGEAATGDGVVARFSACPLRRSENILRGAGSGTCVVLKFVPSYRGHKAPLRPWRWRKFAEGRSEHWRVPRFAAPRCYAFLHRARQRCCILPVTTSRKDFGCRPSAR